MSSDSPPLANRFLSKRFVSLQSNPWVNVSNLAAQLSAEPGGVCNMGPGFTDAMPPQLLRDAMKRVMESEEPFLHQYARSHGHLRLMRALARFYGPVLKRDLDPTSEILSTIGADEALTASVLGLVDPGDEVLIIQPSYDFYRGIVSVAGGIPIFMNLQRRRREDEGPISDASDWVLDAAELRSKFSAKTKLVLLNSPQNPLGKVYSMEELKILAELCREFDAIVINDCVYENLVYDDDDTTGPSPIGLPRLATLPGMWERVLTLGSAGKSFNATGWKLGWAIGPASLIHCLRVVHQSFLYVCPTPIQEAVAIALEEVLSRSEADPWFGPNRAEMRRKRDMLVEALAEAGLRPIRPQGGFFVTADCSGLDVDRITADDGAARSSAERIVRWLMFKKRLVVMPTFPFFSADDKSASDQLVRLCFNKDEETVKKAAEILRKIGGEIGTSGKS